MTKFKKNYRKCPALAPVTHLDRVGQRERHGEGKPLGDGHNEDGHADDDKLDVEVDVVHVPGGALEINFGWTWLLFILQGCKWAVGLQPSKQVDFFGTRTWGLSIQSYRGGFVKITWVGISTYTGMKTSF